MYISKKDLLKETGISYGQLYRWKRERLIPEEWFIKQSSFTGQETFFPREKIINRVRAIQNLKDQYSLDELSKMLSPEISESLFSEDELDKFEEIDINLAATFMDAFNKDQFTFIEILMMIALSNTRKELNIGEDEIRELTQGLIPYLDKIKNSSFTLMIAKHENAMFSIILGEGSTFYIDPRVKIVKEIKLAELSSTIRFKYKNLFNFEFDSNHNEEPETKDERKQRSEGISFTLEV